MFTVIYKFSVKKGKESDFKTSWRKLTELIYQYEGSLGSRLHFSGPQIYIAYAQWPDKHRWEAAGDRLPDFADTIKSKMRSSCESITTEYQLEVVDDLLSDKVYK